MVSAVFHSPLAARDPQIAIKKEAVHAHSTRASAPKASEMAAPAVATASPAQRDWRGLVMAVLPPLLGLGLLIGIWAMSASAPPAASPAHREPGSRPWCFSVTRSTARGPTTRA
jgi:nitrate/nitrite transport system permease protein